MEIVGDEEMRTWSEQLREAEDVWVCPEGAAAAAAADALALQRRLEGPVVLYNTGAGSKYAELLQN
jgi:threonine synthase